MRSKVFLRLQPSKGYMIAAISGFSLFFIHFNSSIIQSLCTLAHFITKQVYKLQTKQHVHIKQIAPNKIKIPIF